MTNRIAETSPHIYARIVGFGLLLMFILAIFANFFIFRVFCARRCRSNRKQH